MRRLLSWSLRRGDRIWRVRRRQRYDGLSGRFCTLSASEAPCVKSYHQLCQKKSDSRGKTHTVSTTDHKHWDWSLRFVHGVQGCFRSHRIFLRLQGMQLRACRLRFRFGPPSPFPPSSWPSSSKFSSSSASSVTPLDASRAGFDGALRLFGAPFARGVDFDGPASEAASASPAKPAEGPGVEYVCRV